MAFELMETETTSINVNESSFIRNQTTSEMLKNSLWGPKNFPLAAKRHGT